MTDCVPCQILSRWSNQDGMGGPRGTHREVKYMPEGKRPPGIPTHIWEDNIKMNLQDT